MDFIFGKSKKELDNLAQTETQLTDANSKPGQNTMSFHFEIHTNLGWIQWKDREATLFTYHCLIRLFERAFAATRCELKIADSLDQFSMEVEIPVDQEDKFVKSFKGKVLAREIDRLHGIDAAICSWTDCTLSNLQKSGGTTNVSVPVTSSCDNLMRRLERLEECGVQRQKEVDAIKDMSKTVLQETKRKLELMESRIDCKVYEKCGSTFDAIETRLMNILREDLLFLGTSSLFGRPEGIDKTDTGVKALIKVLHQTAKKPTSPSPIKAKVTTPLNIQYLEEASRLNLLTMEEKDSEDEPVGRIPFLNAQSQILANSQSQASIATKPFIYTNAEETFSPLKESVTEQDIVPQKTASLLSNPTPIEIKELSLSIPEANELPPLPE